MEMVENGGYFHLVKKGIQFSSSYILKTPFFIMGINIYYFLQPFMDGLGNQLSHLKAINLLIRQDMDFLGVLFIMMSEFLILIVAPECFQMGF